MTEAISQEEMHRFVYNHLYDMNERINRNIYPKITPELMALMSHDAYKEMIQMAQEGYLQNYYDRLIKGQV